MKRKKSVHLYLDKASFAFIPNDIAPLSIAAIPYVERILYTFHECECRMISNKAELHTTLTRYLSFKYGERLFVHVGSEVHEITIGECDGTKREIKKSHNIEKLLLSGEFEWFQPNDYALVTPPIMERR